MKYFFLVIMVAYLGGNIYLFIRTLQQISSLPLGWKILFGVLFWMVATAMFLSIGMRNIEIPQSLSRLMFQTGSAWMIFILYMVLGLIISDIIHIALPKFNGYLWVLGLTICLMIYGYYNYRHPQIVELDIKVDKPLEQPLRIVAISDVHLGHGTGKKALKRYVDMINSQQPDIILIGGDLIDNSTLPLYEQNMYEELNQLRAPMGVYMVAGNHEFISGIKSTHEFLDKTQITLLRDSILTLPCGVQIIGRDDRSNHRRESLDRLIAQCDKHKPIILLDHQPYELAKSDSLGVDLQFSGHTHHGQVFPLSLLTDYIYEQSHGSRHWSHAHIYVSSGLSLWGPPFRIGTKSDMAVIRLEGE